MTGPEKPPPPRPSMDAERLAALLDGALPVEEREGVLDALSGDGRALAGFADAAAVTRELEDEVGHAPDDERIAALLDRRLTGPERDAMLAHLAVACEDYDVFTGTADVLHEAGDGEADNPEGSNR
jgi:hypothetical protein